jgi:hypothetical protein
VVRQDEEMTASVDLKEMPGDLKSDFNNNSDESEQITLSQQSHDLSASNILNWPDNRLRRKTSINDLVSLLKPEEEPTLKSDSKLKNSGEASIGLVS